MPLSPPRWLQHLALLSLPVHDHEPVAGDLQEAYDELSTRHGRSHADLWYARQVLTLGLHRLPPSERILTGLCLFAALYGLWFGTMSLVLGHPGQAKLDLIAATILAQALLTLASLALPGAPKLGWFVALGCLPLLWLVGTVVHGVLQGAELEGYVLLMAFSLALQLLLTGFMLARRSGRSHERPV